MLCILNLWYFSQNRKVLKASCKGSFTMPPHGVCYSLWTVVVTILLLQVFCHIVLQVAIIHLYNKPTFLPVCTDKFQPTQLWRESIYFWCLYSPTGWWPEFCSIVCIVFITYCTGRPQIILTSFRNKRFIFTILPFNLPSIPCWILFVLLTLLLSLLEHTVL